jgi:hypothetical protein
MADGGEGFSRDPDVELDWVDNQSTLLPTADDVAIVDLSQVGGQASRISVVDGGLVLTAQGELGLMTPAVAAWRGGDDLLVATDTDDACTFSFAMDGGSCQGPSVNAVAEDQAGIWSFMDFPTGFSASLSLDVTTGFQSASLPVPGDTTANAPGTLVWESSPSIVTQGRRFVVSYEGDHFALAEYSGGESLLSVTPNAVTYTGSQVLIFSRR